MKLSLQAILKKFAKAGCIVTALLSLTLLSACDLIGSLISSGKDEDKVTISRNSATIEVGSSLVIVATSSEGRAIRWVSADEEIATVEDGEVTGISEGETIVTANDGKKTASCEITVIPAAKVTLSAEASTVEEGKIIKLTATSAQGNPIAWSSSDENVATVDNGAVTGIKTGTATITADDGKAQATCEITVVAAGSTAPVKVTLSQVFAEVVEGSQLKLTATASDGSTVRWSSSDNAIATVDSVNGTVTGVKAGIATITATAGIATAMCRVTVKAKLGPSGKTLVWSDEFNGNSLDMTKWGYQTGTKDHYGSSWGPDYWGNGEMQYYTDGANISFADGALQITAKREGMPEGRTFSSARIVTRDKFSRTFGYFEARMKTPAIDGMWPAFWLLPQPSNPSSSNNEYGGWAANGEIDIMEAKGRLKNKVDTTIHYGGYWPDNKHSGKETTLSSYTDEWHTYAVDWRAEYIAWVVDGNEVYRLNNTQWYSSASDAASAPFDKPFYILLNLATEGTYDPGARVPDSVTQATMYVDYVRVYE